MKQVKNIKIIVFLMIITFLVGINKVSALKCYYKLPFSGMDPSTGNYVEPNSSNPCYTDSGNRFCTVDIEVAADYYGDGKCNGNWYAWDFSAYAQVTWRDIFYWPGYSNGKDTNKDGGNNYLYKMLGTNGSTTDADTVESGIKNVIKGKEKCPKYLIVQKKSNDVFIQNSKFYENLFDASGLGSGNACFAGDDANIIYPISKESSKQKDKYYMLYTGTEDDSAYRNFLNGFYNISGKSGNGSISINSFNLDYYIVPYYTKAHTLTNIPQVEDAKQGARTYVEVFDKVWYNKMVSFQNELESSCGSDWYKYINRKNYNYGGSSDFFAYGEADYNSKKLDANDKDITEKCWNTRKKFFKGFESLQLFMYGMGANTITEFENISNIQTNTISEYIEKLKKESSDNASEQNLYYRVYLEDDTRVTHFKYLLYFFEGVKIGTDFTPDEFRSSKNELVNQKSDSQYKVKVLSADQCAYLCDNVEDKDNYDKCKNSKAEYKTCVAALKTCGASVCDNCIKQQYGNPFTQCMKSCKTVDGKCMEKNGIKDFQKNQKAAVEAAKKEKTDLDKAAEYTFEPAALPTIEFTFKKYEPKCSDVKTFTWVWSFLRVTAPFLLIIFAAFDYFKVVMSGDEEKMKQAKKKIPIRFIAFILLILVPLLLKIFLEDFGTNRANNTTYIKCILTGKTKGE